ncbi:hypothetical protein [Brevibacillus sp. NRS-1366]|uniref:hypothetical protein n=1 Tax=Brevibacillus sp. NRS-1366 TaxID=3233899 RepID=UPI003D20EDF9
MQSYKVLIEFYSPDKFQPTYEVIGYISKQMSFVFNDKRSDLTILKEMYSRTTDNQYVVELVVTGSGDLKIAENEVFSILRHYNLNLQVEVLK